MKRTGLATAIALSVLSFAGSALAQGDPSFYFVTYFSNNIPSGPDATVRVINDGVTGTTLYADFFVFDDSEELTQCCGCAVSPDGLLSESVQHQLTAFPITGKVPTRGAIFELTTSECFGGNPGCGFPFVVDVVPGLHPWATHVQSNSNQSPSGPAPYTLTETSFEDANLVTVNQYFNLLDLCYYNNQLSGPPCTCTPEDKDF